MALIALFYTFLLLGTVIAGGVIVFHLHRYSLEPEIGRASIILFCVVLVALLAINIMSFFAIPLDTLELIFPR